MYSTCIFCQSSLGKNEAIEHFPVGQRLAFDPAKGRLWVVCRTCERWNLTPLDARWEAIEECERLFRDTRLRVSTDNIGLARLKEGTTLVRVGDPQRPEMAAWRYGDQFHRRRRKHMAWVAGGVVAAGGLFVAGPVMGLLGGSAFQLYQLPNLIWQHRTVVRVQVKDTVLKLNRKMLSRVRLRSNDAEGFVVEMQHKPDSMKSSFRLGLPEVVLQGDEALRAARHLLPAINQSGGRSADVTEAVGVLEMARSTDSLFALTARAANVPARGRAKAWWKYDNSTASAPGTIATLPTAVRLALEMSLHEEDERRALEGELAELEDRWREAEEIAAIADDMFVPSSVSAALRRLKDGGR